MVRWINIKSLLFQALEGLFEVYQWFYVTTFWNLLLMINAMPSTFGGFRVPSIKPHSTPHPAFASSSIKAKMFHRLCKPSNLHFRHHIPIFTKLTSMRSPKNLMPLQPLSTHWWFRLFQLTLVILLGYRWVLIHRSVYSIRFQRPSQYGWRREDDWGPKKGFSSARLVSW